MMKNNTHDVLGLYVSGKLDMESSDIVRGWLLSDDDAEEKEEALERLFEEQLGGGEPLRDQYTTESLKRLQEELAFRE
jgi:hypothetical protein